MTPHIAKRNHANKGILVLGLEYGEFGSKPHSGNTSARAGEGAGAGSGLRAGGSQGRPRCVKILVTTG